MNDNIPIHGGPEFIFGSESPSLLEGFVVKTPFVDNEKEHFLRLGHSVVNTLQSWSDTNYIILALQDINNYFHNG